MDLNFQFQFLNTIILIRDYQEGNIIKISRDIPNSFYEMLLIGDNIYYDYTQNKYWQKNSSIIVIKDIKYIQEEYIDVTNLLLEKEKLLNDLKRDPLTKIANLNAVEEKRKKIEITKESCTFVMCDINNFKTINDVYGHATGDEALIQVASLLTKYTNDRDLVARIGGDEFLFIIESDDYMSVIEKMSDLQQEVEKIGQTLKIPLSISLGVASYNKNDNWLLKKKHADEALYHVKHNTSDKKDIAYYNSEKNEFELYRNNKTRIKKYNSFNN